MTVGHLAYLPNSAEAPSIARRFVRQTLEGWDGNDATDNAALLTSELVTNVIRHTSARSTLRVSINRDVVRIEVSDPDRTPLPEPAASRAFGPDGLGLAIVDRVASNWGVELVEDGKIVWFEVVPGPRKPIG